MRLSIAGGTASGRCQIELGAVLVTSLVYTGGSDSITSMLSI